jgi:hypothetical protein
MALFPSLFSRFLAVSLVLGSAALAARAAHAEEFVLHSFERKQLTDEYYSEGANAGDLNNDGHADVVYGPYWWEGPTFEVRHEIYQPKPQNRNGYADNFFNWIYDFNGDGWKDVFTVGFPGKPGYVYENPGRDKFDAHWPKHQVFDSVSNESPQLINIVGDERPELVCTTGGYFGFATIDWNNPFSKWTFHPVSEKIAPAPFGHALGIGDVNGDKRMDILFVGGWFEQPEKNADSSPWTLHKVKFSTAYGGAEMYAYDVDGDGDNDVITSLAAHDFGLAWYEQVHEGDEVRFRQHLIMGDKPEQNKYGLVFSELHSVNLVDMDGDGLKDIVTGKTYWSHHDKSPMWDAGAVVYWFKLVRGKDGVDWIPYKADGESGIGRQLSVADINGDKLPDIVVGGMRGANVLWHRQEKVSREKWEQAQPKVAVVSPVPAARSLRGPAAPIAKDTGKVSGALEGEALTVLNKSRGGTTVQKMSGFSGDKWSGDAQLFWTGAKPGDRLELEIVAPEDGRYKLTAVFTMARDYAIIQATLDDAALGEPFDLYNAEVITTGVVNFGERDLKAGKHRLTLEIKGANPAAVKAYMVGIDYVQLEPLR